MLCRARHGRSAADKAMKLALTSIVVGDARDAVTGSRGGYRSMGRCDLSLAVRLVDLGKFD